MLFKFRWYRCRDKYRLVEPPKTILTENGEGEERRIIVPNSNSWEEFRPLDIPAPYKAFGKWDEKVDKVGPDQALIELTNAYGSMVVPRAKQEPVLKTWEYILGLRNLVAKIESADWEWIKNWLESVRVPDRRGRPQPGVGRLGVGFDVWDGRPVYSLSPPTLLEALHNQALFDAAHGIAHRACKNPECTRYFPISGPDAHRKDALYCSDTCRLRHVYLKKKDAVS